MRVGHGYDVHRLVAHRPLVLGGVTIPYELGLDGHSDADVLLHAVCDALLGAAGLGDIGQHFSPSDQTYRGMDSRIFVREVYDLLTQRDWVVGNIDITLVAEKPRMAPHLPQMITNISADLQIDSSQVNVKATTTEGLGFCGTGEGIACHSVVLIQRNGPLPV
ncbi:MAG: 2-C-methyl-D-erythritol 2,4-cyclodiphosphate synthase [Acidiferrobacterales bacterium]|nr:2-C-methyl-D-erythritol 2,4-cyclodiphosphate synthase [Acidiferrobacterales bacterium]